MKKKWWKGDGGELRPNGGEGREERRVERVCVGLCVLKCEFCLVYMWLDLTKRVSGFERLQDYPFDKYRWICMQGFISNLYGQVR